MAKEDRLVVSGAARPAHPGTCDGLEKPDRNLLTLKFLSHEKSRRTFTADFKARVAIEEIKEIKTISEPAQIYQLHPNLITH
ncbi:MAG: hypothetical protein IPI37_01555 [Bacteroidales bacterium]|nr:hypothetical protein [Bacteroidales bacterium]